VGIVISTTKELESGAGYYGYSATVAADTNVKTVIFIQDSGYRDTNMQVFFSGAVNPAALTAGSISLFQIKLNDQVVYQVKINTIEFKAPVDVMLFIPRNTTVQITQLDIDTVGSCCTMLRGFYLEPPVAQQD